MAIVDIEAGSKASSQLVNDNFHYLQDLVGELSLKIDGSENTVDSKIATVKNTLTNQMNDLQTNVNTSIDELETKVEEENNKTTEQLQGRTFVEKTIAVGIGTTNLSTYLPDDDYNYLIWVEAGRYTTGSGQKLTGQTDLMATARTLFHLDGDAGRSNRDVFFGCLPVGAGRTVTFAGNKDYLNLCGYSRI